MTQIESLITFKRNAIHTAVIYTALILLIVCGFSSYNSNPKAEDSAEDSKDIAEKSNDTKFENSDKEKDAQFLVEAAEINLEEIKSGNFTSENAILLDTRELGDIKAWASETLPTLQKHLDHALNCQKSCCKM